MLETDSISEKSEKETLLDPKRIKTHPCWGIPSVVYPGDVIIMSSKWSLFKLEVITEYPM